MLKASILHFNSRIRLRILEAEAPSPSTELTADEKSEMRD